MHLWAKEQALFRKQCSRSVNAELAGQILWLFDKVALFWIACNSLFSKDHKATSYPLVVEDECA